ncbi:MAG: 2-octaprenyl-6-methoxyphenyl hydroxylase [Gammaproteobacteria bacterium]|nr:2-octaprenyl-6-methoxyphenyl hydroxylase [Gammaproteobacteria bacterium]
MPTSFDVVIVGSGFVGSALARALQDLPLKVAILERTPVHQMPFDQRSIVLSYGSSRILNALGVWDTLSSKTIPIETIQLSEAGRFGMVHLSAKEERVNALGYVVEGGYLQHVLGQATQAADRITSWCPANVVSMEKEEQHWRLGVECEQGYRELRAKLVIGADGTHSLVRRLQKINIEEFDYQQMAIVSQVGLHRSHHHVAYERFTQKGAIAFLPLAGLKAGLVWSAPQSFAKTLMEWEDKLFLEKLQQYFGYRLGRFLSLGQRVSYPLKKICAMQQAGPGWVLIGNAAHTLHPIAAQGFNLGLRDVACLVDVITDALHQKQNLFDEGVTKAYVDARARDQTDTTRFTHRLVRVFSQETWPIKITRTWANSLIEYVPFLKHRIARQAMGLAGRLSRLNRR